jgi:hypothetical protein
MAQIASGNTGQSLESIIEEINKFTAEYPGEVIFFRIKYLVGIRTTPSLGPIIWQNDIIMEFFANLETVNNRCGNLDMNTTFQNQPASYFMDQNQGKGCVIFILDGHLNNDDERISSGIYRRARMNFWDDWTESGSIRTVVKSQADDWNTIGRSSTSENDQFMISQWFAGAPIIGSTIQKLAIQEHNPTLYWYGVNRMSPDAWPNVLMVNYMGQVIEEETDFSQMSADLVTLAVGLNLYMISENCDISKRRNPLLKPLTKKASSFAKVATPSLASEPVIHFANGTIIKNPTPDMYPKGVAILKKGTVFGNGTVLEQDTPNPWY